MSYKLVHKTKIDKTFLIKLILAKVMKIILKTKVVKIVKIILVSNKDIRSNSSAYS